MLLIIVYSFFAVTAFESWVQIMMGRFVSGWGVGGLSAAVPVYQAESVPKQVRGACTSTYQLAITLGSECSRRAVWTLCEKFT